MKSKIIRYGAAGLAVILLIAVILILFRPTAEIKGTNILENSDFSRLSNESLPEGWYRDAYNGLSGTTFEIIQEDGASVAHLVNHAMKDARFAQTVSVSPNALYCLHGYIRADAMIYRSFRSARHLSFLSLFQGCIR